MNFTGIYHEARKQLGLTCNEYCVADMISIYASNPSNPVPGWCFTSRQTMADDMGVSKVSMIALVEKCIQAGVVEKNPVNGNLRITQKFYDAVHASKRIYEAGKESLPSVKKVNRQDSLPSVKNLNQTGKESLPTVGKESLPYINELEINDLNTSPTPSGQGEAAATVFSSKAENGLSPELRAAPLSKPKPAAPVDLETQVSAYRAANPTKYPPDLYAEFLPYWDAPVQNGKKSEIGRPLWATMKTWNLAGRLATWHRNNENRYVTAGKTIPFAPIPGNAASQFNPQRQTR